MIPMKKFMTNSIWLTAFSLLAVSPSNAAEKYLLAKSSKMGLGVYVDLNNGEWCSKTARLRLVADRQATYESDAFLSFTQKLGGVLERECPEIKGAVLLGGVKGVESGELFNVSISRENKWALSVPPITKGTADKKGLDSSPAVKEEDREISLLPDPGELWGEIEEDVTEVLDKRIEYKWEAVERGGSMRDKLDRVVKVLGRSQAENARKELRRIEADIEEHQKKIEEYRIEMVSAPSEVKTWLAWVFQSPLGRLLNSIFGMRMGPTKSTYKEWISVEKDQIDDLEDQSKIVRKEFSAHLRKLGVRLSDDQAGALLSSATINDFTGMLGAYENLKSINKILSEQTIEQSESLSIAKRYYGVHAVLLDVVIHMEQSFVDKIDSIYLVNLKTIEEEAKKLLGETRGKLRQSLTDMEKRSYRGNEKSQVLTLRTVDLYRRYLVSQRNMVKRAIQSVERQRDAAVNTYKTASLSFDLVNMLRMTGKNFNALMQLEIPALQPFTNSEMKREFDRISKRLAKTA